LARVAPPAAIVDKRVYSPFTEPSLLGLLRERGADSLVITGAETDVCVLAAVLDAVDLGYRVVLASDALCSSSDQTHDALMTLYRERFSEQIEMAETASILAVVIPVFTPAFTSLAPSGWRGALHMPLRSVPSGAAHPAAARSCAATPNPTRRRPSGNIAGSAMGCG
jgi:hypothetical protein